MERSGASSSHVTHTIFQGNVFNTQGNVNISSSEAREDPVKALYGTLEYGGMNKRSEQLSLPEIPQGSFNWVWDTGFKRWLSGNGPFFWISGKPGSGKSTLMHYLARTKKTQDLLNQTGVNWTILHFYFDYRAGSGAANDICGLMRRFLVQLCHRFSEIEAKLARRNSNTPLEKDNSGVLIDIFCEAVRSVPSSTCAFIDGLDEYEGDCHNLVQTLVTIQERTGVKICVASRPEPAFSRGVGKYPSFRMQEHNMASVQVYIDRAISRGQDELSKADEIFDRQIRNDILNRAQGVILWAKLAVDELLGASHSSMSVLQIRGLLDKLPEDVESMYDRCLSRIPTEHAAEAAAMLFILNEFGGVLGLFKFSYLLEAVRVKTSEDTSSTGFIHADTISRRISILLGTLFDIVDSSQTIRLSHKTLSAFLSKSARLRATLSVEFSMVFLPHTRMMISLAVVECASRPFDRPILEPELDVGFSNTTRLFPLRPDRNMRSTKYRWLIQMVVDDIPPMIEEIPYYSQREINLLQSAMSSSLMLYAARWTLLSVRHANLLYVDMKGEGLLDLWFAIILGLQHYVRQRLWTLQEKRGRCWDTLLEYSIACLMHTIFETPSLFPERLQIAWLIRYFWERCIVKPDFLFKTLKTWIRQSLDASADDPNDALDICEILLSIDLSKLEVIFDFREDDFCGCGIDHTLHEWVARDGPHAFLRSPLLQSDYPSLVNNVLMYQFFKTNVNVNAVCRNHGTIMHSYLTNCTEWSEAESQITIACLARLGFNPSTSHRNLTILDQARSIRRKLKLKAGLSLHFAGNWWWDRLVEILRYHEKHGRWPDFSNLEACFSALKWCCLDELGQIPLEDSSIDHCDPTPEHRARWIDILARHKNGTLSKDIEQQCEQWLRSDTDAS